MRRFVLLPLGIAVLVTLGLIAVVSDSDSGEIELEDGIVSIPKNDNLRFVLLGDTGGLPMIHETRAQRKVAKQLAYVAQHVGFEAVVTMGDNIYYTGVDNEFDARFESSFETPYRSPAFDGKRFYMIAGNHDHFGNISGQIAYTKYSKKWFYPALYYNFSMKAKDGTPVDFVMVDTIVLCGNTRDIEYSGFWKMLFAKKNEPNGPTNKTAAEHQWKWIEECLAASSAPYLFVIGHYPIHSISSHGPVACMADRLTPLLNKYNVTAYVAGHDHSLQHVTYPNGNGRTMHYIVSGAGSRSDPSTKNMATVQPPGEVKFHFPKSGTIIKQLGVGDGGFVVAEVTREDCKLQYLDSKGDELYTTSILPR